MCGLANLILPLVIQDARNLSIGRINPRESRLFSFFFALRPPFTEGQVQVDIQSVK